MKYIILVGDGMCDWPVNALEGKTPLEVARIPNMEYIAAEGIVGLADMIPPKMTPASDVANLSILGYDPTIYYTGRGPLEAANIGVELKENELAFRCNLITASDDIVADYSAGHISNRESKELIKFLNEKLGTESIRFYPGVSYRHLLVLRLERNLELLKLKKVRCIPPHDIVGQNIKRNLPKGEGSKLLIHLISKSRELLSAHDINKVRLDLKENPANMIWLWGQGVLPKMPNFYEKFGLNGAVISAVDLIKGIGRIIGLEVIDVPGATGYYDTNYLGKAEYALNFLKKGDFVFVHVGAPDEASHNGELGQKIACIERFDKFVVGTVLEGLKRFKDFRILVLADHATPVEIRTHTRDSICFAIYGKGIAADSLKFFNERVAAQSVLRFPKGYELIEYFLRHEP